MNKNKETIDPKGHEPAISPIIQEGEAAEEHDIEGIT